MVNSLGKTTKISAFSLRAVGVAKNFFGVSGQISDGRVDFAPMRSSLVPAKKVSSNDPHLCPDDTVPGLI